MTLLKVPGVRPILFETFASTGGYPNANKTGKVSREPPPATALTIPATMPVSKMMRAVAKDTSMV